MPENLKIKVVLIHNIVSPYRIPVFEGLSKHPLIDLTVFYCAKTHKIRQWEVSDSDKYRYRFLSGLTIEFREIIYHINFEIIPILLKKEFDIIIIGGCSDFTTQAAFILSKAVNKPVVLWSEGIDKPQGRLGRIMSPVINYFIKHSDAIIVPGTRSENYHITAGAAKNKIFIAPNIVDNEFFITHSARFRQDREHIKKEMNIPGKKIIIYMGRLTKKKGVDHLIHAFHAISSRIPEVFLIIVGDGPLCTELQDMCKDLHLYHVLFTGWIDGIEKVKYYSIADVFTLPTLSDLCPLVINEAMCCRLPVVTTTAAGCAVNMVFDGENGFIVKPEESKGLGEAIIKIIQDPKLCDGMGERSLTIIREKFNQETCVEGFVSAIKYSINNNSRY
jgi:glycosyltransferase involved in cell wall biosynthesis